MRALPDITSGIDADSPLFSCGSYRLETLGICLFEKINCQDYTSIIDILLTSTAQSLNKQMIN